MIKKIETLLFILFFLSLPIQLGKHFWPPFAFVDGIRVDYLSPTLYVSDIIIFCFFLGEFFHPSQYKYYGTWPFLIWVGLLLIILLSPIGFARSPAALLFGTLKAIEFVFLGRYLVLHFSTYRFRLLLYLLAIGVIWTGVLGILQTIFQHSVGGIWYFLGERSFTLSTIGLATVSFHGEQLVRPYSTFPHPNVFAFFLIFSLVFLMWNSELFGGVSKKTIYYCALCIGHIALLLTLSRVVLFCFSLVELTFLLKVPHNRKRLLLLIFILGYGSLFFIFITRFLGSSLFTSISFRESLIPLTVSMFLSSPFVGVGFHNFFSNEILYQNVVSPTFLQPVHSVYLLILAENGIVGICFFCFSLGKSAHEMLRLLESKTKQFQPYPLCFLFLIILFASFFDHYFLTLQQPELIVVVLFALLWSMQLKESDSVLGEDR